MPQPIASFGRLSDYRVGVKRHPGFEAAWARVSILLNTGDVAAATEAALEASALTRWRWDFGDYQNAPRYRIYDSEHLPTRWMWFEPAKARVLIGRDAIAEFGLSEPMWDFAALVLRLPSPTFRRFSMSNWRLLDQMADDRFSDQ